MGHISLIFSGGIMSQSCHTSTQDVHRRREGGGGRGSCTLPRF